MTDHPGKLEIVDEEKGTFKTVDFKSVPTTIAFVDGKPVVKVVRQKRGDEVIVRAYGVDGALLATTVGK